MRALSLCFFLKVDEEGAEAAAATVMTACLMSSAYAPPPSTCFAVDHPFLFFILSGARGNLPVFAGHCTLPVFSKRS